MEAKTYVLWDAGKVPGALGTEAADVPSVTVYPVPKEKNTGAAVVVCPGGGYGVLAPHEAEPVAVWLNSIGVTGVVLKYRLGPRYHHPVMLQDVSRAIRMSRTHATDWGFQPQRVGVLGFSAGGHLASTVSTHFDSGDMNSPDPIERASSRPDASILIYPVITMEGPFSHAGSRTNLLGEKQDPELVHNLSNHTHVTRDTPPTFLVHSTDDKVVPVENSLQYATALAAANIPFAMQVYSYGAHGYGMATNEPTLGAWPGQCAAFLKKVGFLPAVVLLLGLWCLPTPIHAQPIGKPASLFNGRTLAGWEFKAVHGGNGGLWEVRDGVLVGNQEPDHKGGLLGTLNRYKDAEVELEFQADEPVDSGLFLRTTTTGDAYQITIDVRSDGTIGSIYVPSGGFAAQDNTWRTKYKPKDWNKLRAVISGSPAHIQVWLNGKQTVDFTDTQKRLSEPGYIGLQVHGGAGSWGDDCRIRYRNISVKPLTPPIEDPRFSPRTAWWRDAKFGMFIHWGLYASPAGYWNGKAVPGIGEWIMNNAQIPVGEYEQIAWNFNPTKFDARSWVGLAKRAGMKYIVITSKHHDGFSMFDTAVNKYNIVAGTPYKRDPMKDLANACKDAGIKFGFYYSIMDWHHPQANKETADRVYIPQMKEQLRELVTKYNPAILWFDGEWVDWWDEAKGRDLEAFLRELKPDIVINNRIGKRKTTDGDYETPEQEIPGTGPKARLWETCMTLNDTWGYKKDDNNWKSAQDVVRKLCDITSKGGNFLLNVGPDAEGVIPKPSAAILDTVGDWLSANGEAIYGTISAPLPQPTWGRITQKGNRLYLIIPRATDALRGLFVPVTNPIKRVALLKYPDTIFKRELKDGFEVSVPIGKYNDMPMVITVDFEGELIPVLSAADRTAKGIPTAPSATGLYTLTPDIAALRGETLKVESLNDIANLGYWTNRQDFPEWYISPEKPTKYSVELTYAVEPGNGGDFILSLGGTQLKGKAEPTGSWQQYRTFTIGTVTLPAQKASITLRSGETFTNALMNLRQVRLIPQP